VTCSSKIATKKRSERRKGRGKSEHLNPKRNVETHGGEKKSNRGKGRYKVPRKGNKAEEKWTSHGFAIDEGFLRSVRGMAEKTLENHRRGNLPKKRTIRLVSKIHASPAGRGGLKCGWHR